MLIAHRMHLNLYELQFIYNKFKTKCDKHFKFQCIFITKFIIYTSATPFTNLNNFIIRQ